MEKKREKEREKRVRKRDRERESVCERERCRIWLLKCCLPWHLLVIYSWYKQYSLMIFDHWIDEKTEFIHNSSKFARICRVHVDLSENMDQNRTKIGLFQDQTLEDVQICFYVVGNLHVWKQRKRLEAPKYYLDLVISQPCMT